MNSVIPSQTVRRFAGWCLALNLLVLGGLFLGYMCHGKFQFWGQSFATQEITKPDRPPENATKQQMEAYQERYGQVSDIMERQLQPAETFLLVSLGVVAALVVVNCCLLYLLWRLAGRSRGNGWG